MDRAETSNRNIPKQLEVAGKGRESLPDVIEWTGVGPTPGVGVPIAPRRMSGFYLSYLEAAGLTRTAAVEVAGSFILEGKPQCLRVVPLQSESAPHRESVPAAEPPPLR